MAFGLRRNGADYVKANPEYERLAKDVLFWVLR
jgi:hypothetical protein